MNILARSHRKLLILISAAPLAAVFVLTGCSKQQAAAPPPAVPVVIAQAVQKNIPLQVRAIGNVEPYSTVQIKAQVNGQLKEVHFVEGQEVEKGQLLFEIDRRPFQAALDQAKSNLARDLAAANNAKIQALRYTKLEQEGVAAREQGDTIRADADSKAAAVQADEAAVETAKVNLSYCSIYAPITGRTGNLAVKPGNLVKENDVPVLVTINQVSPIYVTFAVPEVNLADIKKYMAQAKLKVEAEIPNDPRPAEGVLTFVDNAVDQATGTIKLKGTFTNTDRRLWPGQFVNVVLTLTTEPNRIVVPSQALQTGQQGQFVFVVKPDQTAETRQVAVERTVGGDAIITNGVQPGERVVTDGQMRLAPGVKVEPKNTSRMNVNNTGAPSEDSGV